jgi:uridine phosphorylase
MPRDFVHRNFGGECQPGDIAPYVLVTGTKEQARNIASRWQDARKVADHYEFLIYTGSYDGYSMTVCSTGMGGMTMAIAIEELASLGAKTFLRIDATTPLVDELDEGEIVIAKGAVRWDGTSHDYVRPEYPAMAHFEVIMAAISAAERLGYPYQVGVIGDLASIGSERVDGFRHFLGTNILELKKRLHDTGVILGVGESATMLVQCSIYGFRAGIVNITSADLNGKLDNDKGYDKLAEIGLETIRILAAWDEIKHVHNWNFILPEIPG